MEMNQEPVGEQQPVVARPRDWQMFFAGVAVAWLIPLAVAYQYGPRTSVDYEDPLTGRSKYESTWLGLTTSSRTVETPESAWADLHSIPGTYPAKCGWIKSSYSQNSWFSGTLVACGGYGIPYRIYHGQIVIEGLTREQTFEKYQTECVEAYHEDRSLWKVQDRWAAMEPRL